MGARCQRAYRVGRLEGREGGEMRGRGRRGAASKENVRSGDNVDQTIQRTDSVVIHRRRRGV